MRHPALAFALIVATTTTACETLRRDVVMTEPGYVSFLAPYPDPAYRLPPEERARVRGGFDVAALERLIARIHPVRRAEALEAFQIPRPGESHREVWYFGEPELQTILDEVWAPTWDRIPVEVIEMDDSERPGKARARARRVVREVRMTVPRSAPFRAPRPDESLLCAATLPSVRMGFDPQAVQRLLAHAHPSYRAEILGYFQAARGDTMAELTYIDDPELQAMLEEIWRPFLEFLPLDVLRRDTSSRPGKARILASRLARERGGRR